MKRTAPEPDTAASSDVASIVAALLKRCTGLRDTCGRAYRVVHKLEVGVGAATLRVGRFDRVTLATLTDLSAVTCAGHTVRALSLEPSERTVCFSVGRATAAPAEAVKLEPADKLAALLRDSLPGDAVDTRDVEAVTAAAAALGCAARSARVRRLPACYEVWCRLHPGAPVEPAVWGKLRPWARSYVDLERGRMVAVVDRAAPDL